ncbi:MAG: carbon-nitrogen hydrolase family protein [Bacteroidota bacterium]|jgi:predicted amidohydrolase
MSNIKIGLGQLLVEGGEPDRNLERAYELIKEAKTNGCHIILLPETMDFGWTHPSALDESEPIPGKYSNLLCDWAKEQSIYICAGLTERLDNKNYNSAIFINPQGEIMLKYSKINLLEVEFPFYEVGQKLEVIKTEFGLIGVNICADNYLDGITTGHALARMGAQLILSPSSWTVDYSVNEEINNPYNEKWVKPYNILAKTYQISVVGTTSVGYIVGGPYEGKKMVGCSLAVDPNGIVAQGEFNEFASELITMNINLVNRPQKGTQIGKMLLTKGFSFEYNT